MPELRNAVRLETSYNSTFQTTTAVHRGSC